MRSADRPERGIIDDYGRATARQCGLTIDEAWWPSVIRHLDTLLELAAGVEAFEPTDDDQSLATPAPVFAP